LPDHKTSLYDLGMIYTLSTSVGGVELFLRDGGKALWDLPGGRNDTNIEFAENGTPLSLSDGTIAVGDRQAEEEQGVGCWKHSRLRDASGTSSTQWGGWCTSNPRISPPSSSDTMALIPF